MLYHGYCVEALAYRYYCTICMFPLHIYRGVIEVLFVNANPRFENWKSSTTSLRHYIPLCNIFQKNYLLTNFLIVLNGLDRSDRGEAATPPKQVNFAPPTFLKEASAVTFPICAPALEAINILKGEMIDYIVDVVGSITVQCTTGIIHACWTYQQETRSWSCLSYKVETLKNVCVRIVWKYNLNVRQDSLCARLGSSNCRKVMQIAALSSCHEDNGLAGKPSFLFPRRFPVGFFSHFF